MRPRAPERKKQVNKRARPGMSPPFLSSGQADNKVFTLGLLDRGHIENAKPGALCERHLYFTQHLGRPADRSRVPRSRERSGAWPSLRNVGRRRARFRVVVAAPI